MFNITGLFQSHYQQLLDNSLENGFLVMNDNLGIKGNKFTMIFLSFTTDECRIFRQNFKHYFEVTPYLEFPYQGLTLKILNNQRQSINLK